MDGDDSIKLMHDWEKFKERKNETHHIIDHGDGMTGFIEKNPPKNDLEWIEKYREGSYPSYLILVLEKVTPKQANLVEKLGTNATVQKLKQIFGY